MNSYVIRGGEQGKARLSVLARALHPSTIELLGAAGLGPGMSCLDVGCGGGDVTREMARLVGPEGTAVGVDLDATKLALAREEAEREEITNVEFRLGDVDDLGAEGGYDLVYARFLLSHLPDPLRAARRLAGAARPGGVVVVEDIDHSAIYTWPPSAAVNRYVELYNAAVRSKGADPFIGPKLPELLRSAGLGEVRLGAVQPVFMEGEGKRMHAITLENIADAVIAAGLASRTEIDATVASIDEFTNDPHTIVGFPRIFQVRGRRFA